MILSTGTKLAHYEITSQLGKGGMGEVYQAKDTKLGRDVAIKVLPEEFAKDADSVARFQREAKLLASLNHPNIAAIYGLEESDGTHFLVMELIEGQTLDDRIKASAIPVEEALKLALQIAEALEAAHEKGVIHRDLKPANIKVTPDGKVKVLDFGLAKAYAGERGEMILSDTTTLTLSAAETQKGVILGSPAYMSPEQAGGKTVDRRSDVWAFGVVLYEMLTGHSLFAGDNVAQTLARVLEWQPDFSSLPPNLHPKIVETLERCLEKQVKNRYGSISDARVDIQKALADPGGVLIQPVTADEDRKKLPIGLPWIAAVFILGLIMAGVAVWKLKPIPPPELKRVMRFEYELPEGQRFNKFTNGLIDYSMPVSPDGTQFAYCTTEGIYLHSLGDLTAKRIAWADKDAHWPFFSPDGQWIGYWCKTDMKLKKVKISGGPPIVLTDFKGVMAEPSWGSEDAIVYSDLTTGIMRISAGGGTPETLIEEEDASLLTPQILPDGNSILYVRGQDEIAMILVYSLESGKTEELFKGKSPHYLPTGHIVYLSPNNNINILYAVPFDLKRFKVTGDRIPLLEAVESFAVSDSGIMVYLPQTAGIAEATGATAPGNTLAWVDRQGNEEPLGFDPHEYGFLSISPDGTKVVTCYQTTDDAKDIYILDLNRVKPELLTFDRAIHSSPIWTPDGRRVVFHSLRGGKYGGIYSKAANGTGGADLLFSGEDRLPLPRSWAKDGKALVIFEFTRSPLSGDIGMLSVEADYDRTPLLQEKHFEMEPQVSPDGRWLAYQSDESGQAEIYVRFFPEIDSGRWQVSTEGGTSPLWSPDGRELFYLNGEAVMAVKVETEPTFNSENPEFLFRWTNISSANQMNPNSWAIHPDGDKFLMMKPQDTAATESIKEERVAVSQPKIIIVLNWFEELKERVPVP